jgi:hypothetical protein
VLSAELVLGAGGRQAVRAKLHELLWSEPDGPPAEPPPACDPRAWYRRDDHDDLVLEVAP